MGQQTKHAYTTVTRSSPLVAPLGFGRSGEGLVGHAKVQYISYPWTLLAHRWRGGETHVGSPSLSPSHVPSRLENRRHRIRRPWRQSARCRSLSSYLRDRSGVYRREAGGRSGIDDEKASL